ncbi:uncharacterized protein [Linepithema humile]|uniref:uncharacterized protein n=1 Tax=Linepithema humile TaxID=83485 RepID=UPI00351ECDBA
MSQVDITKDNVWYHYDIILEENFKAMCKICESIVVYLQIGKLTQHLYTTHNEYFISLAKKRLRENPEIYYDNVHLQCRVCLEHLPSQDYVNHRHSATEVAYYETSTNNIEHCTQNGDFTVKCKVVNCGEAITLSLSETMNTHLDSFTHLDKLRSMQTHAMSMPPTIAKKSELIQYYQILPNFQAKCRFCDFQDCYIDITNFSQHVEKHDIVSMCEEKCGKGWPWMYFKNYILFTSECIICRGHLPYCPERLEDHLYHLHFIDKNNDYVYDLGWEWKYCEKSNVFEVRCDICGTEISLDVKLTHFNQHTHHFEDTAGPSGSQQN